MLTHRNKKPYECSADGCNKSYCDARSLRRHVENIHGQLGGGGGGGRVQTVSAVTVTPAAPAGDDRQVTSSREQGVSVCDLRHSGGSGDSGALWVLAWCKGGRTMH